MKLTLTILILALLSCCQPVNKNTDLTIGPYVNNNSTQTSDDSSPYDTLTGVNEKEILDFIAFLISSGELKTENYLSPDPEKSFSDSEDEILNELLIKGNKRDTLSWEDIGNGHPISFTMSPEILTDKDIEFIKGQHQRLEDFQWDTKLLGFTQKKSNYWQVVSLPYFSIDKQKVIIEIRNLCSGLCGTGQTLLFERKDNQWERIILRMWYH